MHVRPVPWDQLTIGDIVVVDSSVAEFPIIHRIIGWQHFSDTSFGILKGDNMTDKDSFVLSQDNYSGKVWARERNGKLVLLDRLSQSILARFMARLLRMKGLENIYGRRFSLFRIFLMRLRKD